ncbi:metallophosphoesterase family protein [Cyanobacterium sp. Dongsha4]|uniref:metallophosphoesterase family protein n=1 Tax=Cyanobacterium sp. DS4 TaxID=2878255 RepID=UPI002E809DAF|nr:metallophosphoesterase [Cyanobacterium sp. Dongsha4]WVL01590.1 metallophosphoesterase [Cyanobacterium sp. Dongsha4]
MNNRKFLIILLATIFICIFSYFINDFIFLKSVQGQENIPPQTQELINKYQPFKPEKKDVRILVISDLNSAYGSTEYDDEVHLALKMLPFWQPDLILCSGDMIAGQKPSLTQAQIRAMWKAFDTQIAQPIRNLNIPFGFTIGNHDASSAIAPNNKFLFQQERDLAVEYWQNPKHNSGVKFLDRNQFPFYYTFEQDDIFFLVWDGSSSRIPKDKLSWVEKSLASEKAQQAKMRIIIGHLPLYAVSEGRDYPGEVLNNADELRQLLEKYNVHTYISGHHHAYYPAHKGELQLLHTGALGSGARPYIDNNIPPRKTITVVDVDFNDPDYTTYTTYNMQDFSLIKYEQLPRLIMGHNGMILRRDISIQNLTEEEKKTCLNKFQDLKKCNEN